jgi:hypothetical protein
MPQLDSNRRFNLAHERARADWAAADPARCAALAGCELTPAGVLVSYFGRPHLVTHPDGAVWAAAPAGATAEGSPRRMGGASMSAPSAPAGVPASAPAHVTIAIVLMHYLLTADGAAPADRWIAFRELPDGLFYSAAFAGHAEGEIAGRFGADVAAFRRAASSLRGAALDLADASYRFEALPRLPVAVLLWAGDDEFPGQARILFDAHASHYLPTEDLAGLGDWLAHKLIRL